MRKPRAITRANAKKGKEEEKLTMRNPGGYMDPTAYFALRNIERDKQRSRRKSARPLAKL